MSLPKLKVGKVLKVVIIPYPGWICSGCGLQLQAGKEAVKRGRFILCPECVRRGKGGEE